MNPDAASAIITGRLLILQSKRLLLRSAQRRLRESGMTELRERSSRLRVETEMAQHAYRNCMITWGSPEHRDYWLIVYGRLVEMGTALTNRLEASVPDLPSADRFEAAADIEMLEDLVKGWAKARRDQMAASIA
jgi:hypothetical protein